MKCCYGIVAALCAGTVVAVSFNADTPNASAGNHTQEDFESFCQSLGLSTSDVDTLWAKVTRGTADVEVACLTAQASLGDGQVDTTPLNQTVVSENWSQACIAEPHCIIEPSDTSDVSASIKIIDFFEVKFAVRSGGHSPNPGWSSIGDQGILFDMHKMNQVNLSSDGKVASVGPGARWGGVMASLDPQRTTVIGGRLPHVGVAGLILGGGYFHTSGEFGLAADNVKTFEVVLANGTVVDANADENNDLFWALKGGGPNFGIVTQFDLYTVPVYDIWVQVAVYSTDQAFDVLDAFAAWQHEGASDLKSAVGLILGLDSITVGLIYSAPAELPGAFAPFYDLEPLQVAVPPTNATFAIMNQILDAAFPTTPARHDYRGASSRVDVQLNKDVYTFWREKALAVREATGANQTFALQHIPANMAQRGVAMGGNPLGLSEGDQQWWTTIIDWTDEKDDDLVRSVSIETTEEWEKLGKERGLDLPFVYLNDASRDQNPLASYGSENVAKLKEISQKYDAKQIFQTLQNSGFLLSKV